MRDCIIQGKLIPDFLTGFWDDSIENGLNFNTQNIDGSYKGIEMIE